MTDSDRSPSGQTTGQRGRIRVPAPPAPVPAPRAPRRAEPAPDLSRSPRDAALDAARDGDGSGAPASDADVVRSTGSMAVATLISRITGFLRNVLIGATLGPAVASAFNTANTLPNLITEIVLGAVLTSLVVPVLVRAEKEDPDRGEAFIRRLLTMSLTLLGVITVLAIICAPLLTRIQLNDEGRVNVPLATAFAFLLLPQIIFYGIFSLFMAVLNTKGVFRPGAWAPVANNVIAIATLLLYWTVPGRIHEDAAGTLTDPHILLVGLGTTLGVVVQALIMLPPLLKAGINLKPMWGIDDRIKQFAGMGVAIVAYVAISQLGYIVTTRIASTADAAAPTVYQQAWLLLQVPYGIIGVTLLTAIMPRLSRNASDGDDDAVVRDLTVGTKLTMLALIPVVVFFTAFGTQIANALFAYGAFPASTADILGWTLSFSAFTLIPYALVLLHLRVFYAREEAWTPTFIIFGITVVKVLLSSLSPLVASSREVVVVLLGAANGFGFVAGAVIGVLLLRRVLGPLGGGAVLRTCLWALGASAAGAAVAAVVDWALSRTPVMALGSVGFLVRMVVAGVAFLAVAGVVLSRSGLAEVAIVGRVLGRIPGLRRFAPAPEETPDGLPEAEAASAIGESNAMAGEGFIASPVLPPMPSEGSRPPRFVPGEIVGGGRFRLISEESARPGVRFWRARAAAGGREVGMAFIDAVAAPHVGRTVPAAAAEIASAARTLRDADLPGVAGVLEVRATRTNVTVITEWVPGVPLESLRGAGAGPSRGAAADAAGAVAADDRDARPGELDPAAVALAVSDVFEAVAAARESGAVLGLDGPDRMRVTVDGRLRLAFPAPLAGAGADDDAVAAADLLEGMLGRCGHVPDSIADQLRAARDGGDPAAIAEGLREAAYADEDDDVRAGMSVEAEAARAATGRSRLAGAAAGGRAWGVGALVVGLVLVAAVVAVVLFAMLDKRTDAPVNPDSVRRGGSAVERVIESEPVVVDAAEWQAPNPNPQAGADNPDQAPLAVDGDPATAWSTSAYLAPFAPPPAGFKSGVGLMLQLDDEADVAAATVTGAPGTVVEIRAADGPASVDPAALPLLGTGTLGEGPTDIALDGRRTAWVLVWVTGLPQSGQASVAEVALR
ncbi:murein biosynthesis integral membrane protein MurJ [Corynebacterium sp. 335C]